MTRVVSRISLLVALAMVLSVTTGCAKKVTVQDGTIVMCTAGHVISDDTRELEVTASKVGEYGVTTRTETCAKHLALAKMLGEAQKAFGAGDLEKAKSTIAKILAEDPTNQAAKQLSDKVEGKNSGSSGGSGSQTATETETPTGPVMVLSPFVPDKLDGFVAQGLQADAFVLTRTYLPDGGPMNSLVIVAEQFKDAKSANDALSSQIKSSYPSGAATVKVGGKNGYFGANGGVAVVAFVSDNVLVAIEGSAKSGKGTELKSALTFVADQIAR